MDAPVGIEMIGDTSDVGKSQSSETDRTRRSRTSLSSSILELYGEYDLPSRMSVRDIYIRTREVRQSFNRFCWKSPCEARKVQWLWPGAFGGGIYRGTLNRKVTHSISVHGFNVPWNERIFTLFPLISQLRSYRLAWIPLDILAGITVGMTQFTQVFGNAQTASLKPWHGTFILLYPGLIYAFMTSSPHNSVGGMPTVVATLSVSFMTIQDIYYPGVMRNGKLLNNTDQLDLHFIMGPSIALTAGCIQIILGLFKLGFLSAVLSPNVIQPFQTACFLQSIAGKIPTALGIPRLVHFHYGKHFRDLIYMCRHFYLVNGWEALMSFSMASIVLVFREWLQPRIYKAVKVVIPIEFFLFIVFAGLTYALDLKRLNVITVGNYNYTMGLLKPAVPNFSYMWDAAWAGLVLAIVSYTVTLESAYILARKNGDQISPNQELLALGSAHVFGSFFWCIPVGAPIGRGSINQACGSRSQLSTLMACLFAGLVVQFAGPAISYLPICIIATNMILFLSMSLGGFLELPRLWRNNKFDALTWMITFIGCVGLNVQIGLLLGIGLSLLSLFVRSQKPKVRVMGILPNTNWGFVALKHYDTARELPGIRVFQIQSPLSYANAEFIVKQVSTLAWEEYPAATEFPTIESPEPPIKRHPSLTFLTGRQNPAIRALASSNTLGSLDESLGIPATQVLRNRGLINKGLSASMAELSELSERSGGSKANSDGSGSSSGSGSTTTEMATATRIILDLGATGYIDAVGIRALEQIASDLKRLGMETLLAQCTGPLLKQLKRLEIHKIIPENNIFPSVVDAVEESIRRIKANKEVEQAGEVVEEYEDERFWDVPVVPVEGLPVVDLDKVEYTDD